MNVYEVEKEHNEDDFEQVLNELYGEVKICGMTFNSGYALRELDLVGFRCGMSDFYSHDDCLWVCGNCNTEFEDEAEAEECCKIDY